MTLYEDDFCSLNILNIHNQAKQYRLKHVFNIFNKIGSDILDQILLEFLIFIITQD